ncbi:MAG: hypothetical protein WAP52_00500 [Candidatus Sungiibacteriota bacterium]
MSQTNILKQKPAIRTAIQQEVRRDENAWRGLEGVWRNKTVTDPVRWQKKIRKEWQRISP